MFCLFSLLKHNNVKGNRAGDGYGQQNEASVEGENLSLCGVLVSPHWKTVLALLC